MEIAYALLLFIASLFYTSSDKLVIYGFGIMGLITLGFLVMIVLDYEKIRTGFSSSAFAQLISVVPKSSYVFWGMIVVFFLLAIKMIFQVVLQLGRRASKLGSTDLQLSGASMRVLKMFRNAYYVFIIALPLLVLSFTWNYKGIPQWAQWAQLALFITLIVVFFIFADLFIKGEFVKIKNDSIKPNPETRPKHNQSIGDTSVVVR